MEKLLIEGGRALNGTIRVSGAKNSAVALIPATILADTPVTIGGVPNNFGRENVRRLTRGNWRKSNVWTGGRDGSRSF